MSHGFDFSASHAAVNASRHCPLPAALLRAIREPLFLIASESGALLVVAVLLRQIAEKVLQVNQVRRVFDQALREQIVRIIIVGLFGAALAVLEHRLQPLTNGRRDRRQGRCGSIDLIAAPT